MTGLQFNRLISESAVLVLVVAIVAHPYGGYALVGVETKGHRASFCTIREVTVQVSVSALHQRMSVCGSWRSGMAELELQSPRLSRRQG